MPAKDFECQLALGQIGRYLSGDRFGQEALNHLESHIQECEECRSHLIEKRSALQRMLNQDLPTHAVVEIEDETPVKPSNPYQSVLDAIAQAQNQYEEPVIETPDPVTVLAPAKTLRFGKAPLYAGALSIVLVGMSFASNSITGMLNNRVANAAPVAEVKAKTPKATYDAPLAKAPVPQIPAPTAAQSAPAPTPATNQPISAPRQSQTNTTTNQVEPSRPKRRLAPLVIVPKAESEVRRPVQETPRRVRPIFHVSTHPKPRAKRAVAPRTPVRRAEQSVVRLSPVTVYGADGKPISN